MRFLSIVRQHFSQAASHPSSFKASLHDSAIRQNKISKQNLQKLDVLAEIILTMKNAELDYLKSYLISNSKNAEKTQISAKVYSALSSQTENQLDHKIRMHFYQQEWIQQVWKDKHILTTLISTEPDAEIDQQQAEVIKQIYDFELTSVDPAQKIKVIKVLRELLGLGLKEAKDVVDKAPIVFKKGKKQEGQGIQKQLAAAGCVVTLK